MNENSTNGSRVNRNQKLYDQHPSKKKNRKPRKKRRKWWLIILVWLFILGFIGSLAGAAVFFTYANDAPNITEADLASENSSEILDNQGKVIWTMSTQQRDYASNSDIPKQLKQAITSIEDRRFYKHNGVDPIRILGAALANFKGSSLGMQGGSTLTQQLVKLSVFSTSSSDQTLKRKAQEAWLAMRVEKNFSKNQILNFYINKVYMGHGVYGMKTASEYFYDKPLTQLSLAQLALLAGLPQSPTNYDPYSSDTSAAKARRNLVLQSMATNNIITQKQANEAKKVSVTEGLKSLDSKAELANANRKVVDAYVSSTLSEVKKLGYDTTKSGLKIYTNMDSNLQQNLYDTVNGTSVAFPSDQTQVGATMTNPENGRVVAQIGGRNVSTTLALNRATQTTRSSGSSIKPLLDYGPAIEYLNWPTNRTVVDKAYKYTGTNISLNNWDGKFMGNITMRTALTQSRNTPAARTLEEVGGTRAGEFVNSLGIPTSETPGGSAAIGIDFSSEQAAAAFGAVANGGTYYKPSYVKKITTADGTTHNFNTSGKRAMKSSTAFMLTDMMKGVIKPNASAADAEITGLHQAGKSGLVSYAEDAGMPDRAIQDSWFTGYTRSYALSVWTGYDQPKENYIPWESQDLPAQIYQHVMSYAMSDKENKDWVAPDTVTPVVKGNIVEYEVKDASWSNGGLPAVNSISQSGETPAEAGISSGSASVGSNN